MVERYYSTRIKTWIYASRYSVYVCFFTPMLTDIHGNMQTALPNWKNLLPATTSYRIVSGLSERKCLRAEPPGTLDVPSHSARVLCRAISGLKPQGYQSTRHIIKPPQCRAVRFRCLGLMSLYKYRMISDNSYLWALKLERTETLHMHVQHGKLLQRVQCRSH